MKDSGFLTIEDVAQYLGIKVKTLYARVSKIPHYRVGRLIRFKKEDVDAWMESKKRDGTAVQPTRPRKSRGPTCVKNTEANAIVRKAIDEVRDPGYTSQRGKSDRIKGLGKE